MHGVQVVTRTDGGGIDAALAEPGSTCFVLTNTRSLPEADAVELNARLGRSLLELGQRLGAPVDIVSRSDSTLRGHFIAEVRALDAARRRRGGRGLRRRAAGARLLRGRPVHRRRHPLRARRRPRRAGRGDRVRARRQLRLRRLEPARLRRREERRHDRRRRRPQHQPRGHPARWPVARRRDPPRGDRRRLRRRQRDRLRRPGGRRARTARRPRPTARPSCTAAGRPSFAPWPGSTRGSP